MKLSLHILSDWLQKYEPVCSISQGERTIRNVRIFSDELDLKQNNVYVGRTGGDTGNVICIHENDYLILNCQDELQILNEIMDAFDFYNGWSDGIQDRLDSITMEKLLQEGQKALKGHLLIADASYYILSYSPSLIAGDDPFYREIEDQHIMNISNIINIEKDHRVRRRISHCYLMPDPSFPLTPCVRNLFTGGRHWGWLIAAADRYSQGQMDLQEELAELLERWMRRHQETQNHLERNGVFLSILDQTYESRNIAESQLQVLGWNPDIETTVYVFDPPDSALALFRKVSALNRDLHVFLYDGRLTAVYSGAAKEQERMERELAALLTVSGCRCGASPVFTDLFTLKDQYRLALTAAQRCEKEILHFQEIAFPYAVEMLRSGCGSWLIHPAIDILKNYDEENHTDFTNTFHIYLNCERNIARTARTLNVHRNTLLYRIERISELIRTDLDDPQVRLHLLLSFACMDFVR